MAYTILGLWILTWIIILFVIKDLLFWLYVLQLKEYRRDKLKDFFVTAEWYKTLFSKKNALRLTMLVWLLISFFLSKGSSVRTLLLWLIACNVLCIMIFLDLLPLALWRKNKKLKQPDWTKRMIMITWVSIIAICLIIIIGHYALPSTADTTMLPLRLRGARGAYALTISLGLQLSLPIIALLSHLIISPIAWFEKKRILSSAQKKIKTLSHLTTIGISGSYGKSSIKMLLHHLLNNKEEHNDKTVLSTPWNINTEIGISQYILSKLSKAYQYFICEFGTYNIGESKLIGEIVNQKIGFLTGLNNQHVWLFGSLMNAISAETEILIKLRENKGMLYANRDDHLVRSLAFDGVQLVKYSIADPTADAYVSDLIGEPGKYEFKLQYRWKAEIFKTDLIGKHNILNLAGVLTCCLDQWIAYEILYEHCKNLAQFQKTLHISQLSTVHCPLLTLIDDTYNINQNWVKAWLDLLSEYKWKKIVFIDEIIELGHETEETHKQLWQTLAQYDLDAIYLTGKNYGKYIKQWIRNSEQWTVKNEKWKMDNKQWIVKTPDNTTIQELVEEPATVLFLGRGTQVWLEKLKSIW